jgi:hypothetical protein
VTRPRTRRKRTSAPALPPGFEEALASIQSSVMAPAVLAPTPRWSRVHRALEDLSRRGDGAQRVRSPFLIPLA